ncbi:hypothetical protein IV102_35265 [bacterium]|nr:hypothetical protein [bacterium]
MLHEPVAVDGLSELYNHFDPLAPAHPDQYLDCSDVRGGKALLRRCRRELLQAKGYRQFLFSGHIGGGKSSELIQLAAVLAESVPRRVAAFVLDLSKYLEPYDTSVTEIYLSVVTELADQLLQQHQIDLGGNFFRKRGTELKEILFAEVTPSAELNLGFFKLALGQLKGTPEARKLVRERLAQQIGNLRSEVNQVFTQARAALQQRGFDDLFLILDNLDKVRRFSDRDEGDASYRALFLENASNFQQLEVHLLLTVPLTLVRAHGPQLEQSYGSSTFVLPMVKVRDRNGHPYEKGRQRLRELVQKRLKGKPLGDVFASEALEWIINYSGGDLRTLVRLVRSSSLEQDQLPITLNSARTATGQISSTLASAIRHQWWAVLVQLERRGEVELHNRATQELMEQLAILEYVNGDDAEDPFDTQVPWYAVHPIVRELKAFKQALAASSAIG